MKASFLTIIAVAHVAFGVPSYAAISTSGPFVGTMSETWESFPYYNQPGFGETLNNPTTIMGGNASIAGPHLIVYQVGLAPWGLSNSGNAQASDGVKGLGLGGSNETGTITWAAPVASFGGYFGAATGVGYPDPAMITVSFFDTASLLIGTEVFSYSTATNPNGADGHLEWHGWTSSEPIGSITITGDYVAMDGLQATTVPEPSAFALVGLVAAEMAILFRRKQRF